MTPSAGSSPPTTRRPEPPASPRCASGCPRRDRWRPVGFQVASALTPHLTAVHMTWGAVNEWTTQAAYARLARLADHPTLSVLLRRIMKQEGRHIDFYATEANGRLADSRDRTAADPVGAAPVLGTGRARGWCRRRRSTSCGPTSSATPTAAPWPSGSTGASTGSRASRGCTCCPARWRPDPVDGPSDPGPESPSRGCRGPRTLPPAAHNRHHGHGHAPG